MREIKFRVWDNVNYMSSPFTLSDLQIRKIQFTSDCRVMQYIGLKDKNGKEIYEGDVVKDIVVHLKSEIVFTDYANFGLNPLKGEVWGLEYEIIDPAWAESTLEIIGNIYENPELLNSEQNVQVSDTTGDDSSSDDGKQIKPQ